MRNRDDMQPAGRTAIDDAIRIAFEGTVLTTREHLRKPLWVGFNPIQRIVDSRGEPYGCPVAAAGNQSKDSSNSSRAARSNSTNVAMTDPR